ncbi:MAG: LPP20 family lipoprotein [Elusimicrobia bacterium]|nr:LPP20 family lipoprotein [Elusimicrobiota bacterium]
MNARVRSLPLIVLAGAVAAAGCHGVSSRVKKGQVEQTLNQSPTQGGFVEALGIGASDPTLPTDTQRKALARDAAIVKAQYEMLSMVKGVQLEGGVTVQQAIETNSTLEARLKESIRGAEIVKSEFTSDNGCVVTIRIPRKRLEDLMGVKFK